MARSLIEPPDEFSINPLLSILPLAEGENDLSRYSSALYARFERAQSLHREGGRIADPVSAKRTAAEEQMLRQVLELHRVNSQE